VKKNIKSGSILTLDSILGLTNYFHANELAKIHVMSIEFHTLLPVNKYVTEISGICVACLYNSAYGVFTLDSLIVCELLLLVATSVLQN